MIDIHSHVLFGLDDGPEGIDGSIAICHDAVADGITTIVATPHVRDDHPTTAAQMQVKLALVRAEVGDLIRVLPGGEVALPELERPLDELKKFALGGNPDYLLVETPYFGWPADMAERLGALIAEGVTPVLAHPERNPRVQDDPTLVEPVVDAGVLVQLTAGSVDGRFGHEPQATAFRLLELGCAHVVSSDAHAANLRAIGMSGARRALDNEPLARWLMEDVPGAIVDGGPVPDRPGRKRRK